MRPKRQSTDLTRAELEVMQIIWHQEKTFLGEVVEAFADPRPAYTTVSTVIRTLETKGYVKHHVVGKSHQYYPAITKEEYRSGAMLRLMSSLFDNSPGVVLSFLAESDTLSAEQHEELKRIARQIIG